MPSSIHFLMLQLLFFFSFIGVHDCSAFCVAPRPFHNLCQTSIFIDVVLAPLVAGLLFVLATNRNLGKVYATWMFLISPGCCFALYCAQHETETKTETDGEQQQPSPNGEKPKGD